MAKCMDCGRKITEGRKCDRCSIGDSIMDEGSIKCPECGKIINHLFRHAIIDVYYKVTLKRGKLCERKDMIEEDRDYIRYQCPECQETIAEYADDAKDLLNGG